MAPARLIEDDPVTAEYDIFITPQLEEKLYILQFPTRARDSPYNEAQKNKPLEMRIKPQTGFIELDVPINTEIYYNRAKAKTWGEALDKAKIDGAHGYGLAAGFGNATSIRAPVRPVRREGVLDGPQNRSESEEEVHNMSHQTLGGQILREEPGKPFYMIGTFQNNQLHLTKLDGIVQMRPQFHHIDAKTQVDRNKTRRDREAIEPPRTIEPRMVQVTVKSGDGENFDHSSTKEFLQAAQDESWTTLEFHDEEVEEAYIAYSEHLFLQDTAKFPRLKSSMNNEEYLDAISAPRLDPGGKIRVKPMAKKHKMTVDISDEEDGPTVDQRPRNDIDRDRPNSVHDEERSA